MSSSDLRWRQRQQNFSKALTLLSSPLKDGAEPLNDLEKEGVVQRFEYTVELAWKTLKDYLEFSGATLQSLTPKSVIKAAFAARLLSDGQVWIDMLDLRNSLSHQYDESLLDDALSKICLRHLPALQELHLFLEKQQ